MKITLITTTGGRPEAFSLCERWMTRQSKDFDEWIVVDDGETETKITAATKIIRPKLKWQPGFNTQAKNLKTALIRAAGEVVLFIEDDDWYHPKYIERMVALFKKGKYLIVGEGNPIYYNLKHRAYKQMYFKGYATLAQTGIREEVFSRFKNLLESGEKTGIDTSLWNLFPEQPERLLGFRSDYFVGIKGSLGRPGIGLGHLPPDFSKWTSDPSGEALRRLIKSDFRYYEDYFQSSSSKLQAES